MKIGIIGAGMTGLALAQRLTKEDHEVTVFEREPQPGGLATFQDHGEFIFDRFYHVILPTDRYLISFIEDIGLGDKLRWRTTLTGFFVDRKTYSVSNALEYLKFPPLSLWSKFRLGFTILYCSRINDWQRLEKITVEDWLLKLSGRATYEKLWKPLLLAKLGENYRRVSAVFIWSYIKRMFSARDKSASREQMGHVWGGYKTVLDRLVDVIARGGGSVKLGVTVKRIFAAEDRGVEVLTDKGSETFDKIVFTGPVNVLQQVVDPALVDVQGSGKDVEYLGVLCMALVTRIPLTPFYVLNIADEQVPFTGVIGMSTVVDTEETAGLYLTYLPKYMLSTDDEMRLPEEQVRDDFMRGLRIMFPDLDDTDIVSARIHRAVKVQPLQVLNFSEIIPTTQTRHPDFFVLNTAQFVNNTLNNNEVIRAVDTFVEMYRDTLVEGPATPADLQSTA
ncbi:MAG TPA: NAD(P)/FAD-dependent oxidoreductase [Woeseiaceae bacterium]|nr:NAD(P)/FAD-dependent oxidoreductase [Woeseiaceae bacterium]